MTRAEQKLEAIFTRAPWLKTDGKAVHLPISGMPDGHQVTWPEVVALMVEIDRLRTALDKCMVGGNHLANILIQKFGPDFVTEYPPDLDPESALCRLCATTEYDVWCCWAAIMRARNIADQQSTQGSGD